MNELRILGKSCAFFLIFVLPVVALFAQTERTQVSPKPRTVLDDPDEYRVYEAVVRKYFGDASNRILVLDRNVGGCGAATVIPEAVGSKLSSTQIEEINIDCTTKKGNYEFNIIKFALKSKIELVSRQDLEKLFVPNCEDGWKKFYEKYPNSKGNVGFSRVGFDVTKKVAALNFGYQSGCLAGQGKGIYLQKTNDEWVIIGEWTMWIS